MKISARNQFEGVITALVTSPVNAEVTLGLAGGDSLVAVVTAGSVLSLGLAVGGRAIAIVKAPWVIVAVGDGGPRFSARNQWAGVVSAVKSGPVSAEVAIRLPGGVVVHAVITQDAVLELGLAPGVPARAVIQASHVVLAVAG
jgi:molybdate transport system regulatory protein